MELTAGGGGATEERKKKIVERNTRVGEQRVKRKEREAEEEGEEGAEGETTIGEDGEPVKKKTKVRGGRRGKAVSVWRVCCLATPETETCLAIVALYRTEKEMERMQGLLPVGQRDPRERLLRQGPGHHLVADEEVDVVVPEAVRAVVEEAEAMAVGGEAGEEGAAVGVEDLAGTGSQRVPTPWSSVKRHFTCSSSRALYLLFIIMPFL